MRKLIAALGATCSLLLVSPVSGEETPAEALRATMNDHWAYYLSQYPVFATSVGVRDYDDRLGEATVAAADRATAQAELFLDRLNAIDASELSPADHVNYQLLRLNLENEIAGAAFGGKYLLMTNRNGPHTYVARLPTSLPFFTKADFESYVARLGDVPRYLEEASQTLNEGVELGWVQPCSPMKGVEASIRHHAVDDVEESVFLRPFSEKPGSISKRDWKRLSQRARETIETAVIPAIRAYADFYDETYAPNCRDSVGALALPDGLSYYQYRANVFTTTDRSTDDIHNLGLAEVRRIRAEMMDIIDDVEFDGDFKEFQEFLRTDPRFYAKTPEELVAATALISKKADGVLPLLFTKMPRMPYTVKPVPADIAEGTTTAYYERPAGDGSRAGVYRINTSLLDQRPLFELEALSLHEAVPGHHFQIALSQELDLPNFRRFGFVTAFSEGWGLYAESLGLDVGFYQDPYSNFGRLSYEMWRACRLVVDTGIHAKGWSKQDAINFMAENTALSLHNIEAEVNRYITWPGQALAYKMGELKIKELRARASDKLGSDFDLRRFHDAVLENGAIPLSMLEANIDAWIEEEKTR